jgi:ribosomal small subunit protein bTHX
MGKGDQRTRRGKIFRSSYGKNRRRKAKRPARPAPRSS